MLVILVPVLHAPAAQSDKPVSSVVYELGAIEVVGYRDRVEPIAESIRIRAELDEELVEDVVEAADRSPGVTITIGDKNEPQILIRGLSQKRTLILYDGIPMAAPYYGDVDMSEVPLDNLSELKIVRGNASVLYGPNALGGVVSFVSAKPGESPNLTLLSTIDQEGNYTARFSHGRRFPDLYYQISAGIRNSDGWRMSGDFQQDGDPEEGLEQGDIRDHSAFSQWSASVKLGTEWDRGELSLSGSWIDAEKEIPPSTDPEGRIRFWDFPTWKKSSYVLAGRTRLGMKTDLRLNAYYHTYDNVLRNYNDAGYSELRWESTYDDYSTGIIARGAWEPSEKIRLKASLNGALDNHRSQGDIGDPWEEYRAMTYSTAGEAEYNINDSILFQVGLGYDWYDFDSVSNIDASIDAIGNRTRDINAFGFSLLASYVWRNIHRITGAVSSKTKFPTMNQLFTNIEDFEPADVGTIDPESALQYSMGYELRPESPYSAGLSAYLYDIDDLIERPTRDDLYTNYEKATIQGIELWAGYGESFGLNAMVTYAYTDATHELADGAERRLPNVPEHSLQFNLGYRFPTRTDVSASYTHRGKALEYTTDEGTEVPSYSLVDLSVNQTVGYGIDLILKATNLFDEDYYQETGFPRPGRTVKLGVRYRL